MQGGVEEDLVSSIVTCNPTSDDPRTVRIDFDIATTFRAYKKLLLQTLNLSYDRLTFISPTKGMVALESGDEWSDALYEWEESLEQSGGHLALSLQLREELSPEDAELLTSSSSPGASCSSHTTTSVTTTTSLDSCPSTHTFNSGTNTITVPQALTFARLPSVPSDQMQREALTPTATEGWKDRCFQPSLGSGSYGTVWLTTSTEGKRFAAKLIRLESEQNAQRIAHEIDLLRSLRHPRVVAFLGSEVNAESCEVSIFMEYVSGGSLMGVLGRGKEDRRRMNESLAAGVLKQVLIGMQVLHSQGIIHRDIKGENVLVDEEGNLKLADFGCAKKVTQETAGKTSTGTPGYMAPEVINASSTTPYTFSADVWSFGCLAHEVLLGREFMDGGEGCNHFAVIFFFGNLKQEQIEFPQPMASENGPSEAAIDLLQSALRVNPAERPEVSALLTHRFFKENLGPGEGEDSPACPLRTPLPIGAFLPPVQPKGGSHTGPMADHSSGANANPTPTPPTAPHPPHHPQIS